MGLLNFFMRAKRFPMGLTISLMFILTLPVGCAHKKEAPEIIPQNFLVRKSITLPEYSVTHDVFVFANDSSLSKPPVLLLHELPGLNKSTIEYAASLQDQFTVYVPLLFGSYGQNSSRKGLQAYNFNGEWWKLYKPRGTRRITQWLRHLLGDIAHQHPEQNIGIIGMCLTGAMPLALLDNQQVNAVVIAQPSLPLLSWFKKGKRSLDLSDEEWETAKRQFKERSVYAYGVRFEKDTTARREKHLRLKEELNCENCKGAFIDAEIPETEYQKAGLDEDAHSTLIAEWKPNNPDHPSSIRRKEIREFLLNPSLFSKEHSPSPN